MATVSRTTGTTTTAMISKAASNTAGARKGVGAKGSIGSQLARLKGGGKEGGQGSTKERQLRSTNRLLRHQLQELQQSLEEALGKQQEAEVERMKDAHDAKRERARAKHLKREADILKYRLESLSDDRMLELEMAVRTKDELLEELQLELKMLKKISMEQEMELGKSELHDLLRTIQGLKEEVRALKMRNHKLNHQNTLDTRALNSKQDEIASLSERIRKMDNLLAEGNKSLDMASTIKKLRKELGDRDHKVTELTREVKIMQEAKESMYKRLKKELRDKEKIIAGLMRKCDGKDDALAEKDRQLREAEVRVKEAERIKKDTQRKVKELTSKVSVLLAGANPFGDELPSLGAFQSSLQEAKDQLKNSDFSSWSGQRDGGLDFHDPQEEGETSPLGEPPAGFADLA